jgi:MarR family
MRTEVNIQLPGSPTRADFGRVMAVLAAWLGETEQLTISTDLATSSIQLAFVLPDQHATLTAAQLERAFRDGLPHCLDVTVLTEKPSRKPRNVPNATQARYLDYIEAYTKLHRQSPSQAEIQKYLQVTPPTVHQMILRLEKLGFLTRVPGQARSLNVVRGDHLGAE